MDLKLKQLNITHLNKSNTTHPTNQKLYDTLYESIILDQEALDDQNAEPSFHKQSHDHQDPPIDHDRKKKQKDAGQSSSKSSSKDKAPMGTKALRGRWASKLIQLVNATVKCGGDKKLTVGFHREMITSQLQGKLWLYDEVHEQNDLIKFIQKDELIIADLEAARLEKLKQYLSTGEKYATLLTKHFAARYYIQGIEDMISKRWSKEVHHYQIKALNGIHHWEDGHQDFFKAEINLRRLNLNDIEDMYLLKFQDKLHHLELEFKKDFNNALLLLIRRTVIKNRVEDLQLGVESYQRTLNLTKPKLYFEGIDDRIQYTMSGAEKGIVYLNQHNRRSLIKLNEVHKLCDGTLMKIPENLIEMVTKNKLGLGNEKLKGRDWNEKDIKRSKEMLDKID
ncbi:hypothetical protein Tco_1283046 [Tanacetum coccineum]